VNSAISFGSAHRPPRPAEPGAAPPRAPAGQGTARLLRRSLPFMGLALLADLSALVPPGPSHLLPFEVGTILLGFVCAANALPWGHLPRWAAVLPSCLYVVSASLIILSVGSLHTGMLPIFLVPVLWTALYQQRWQSAVVVSATILAIVGLSISERDPLALLLRSGGFWGASSIVLSVTTHGLRTRLGRALADQEELLRQADSLSEAAQLLTSLHQTDAVLSEACHLAAVMVSPPGLPGRGARYFRVDGDTARGEWEFDEAGAHATAEYALAEDPYLSEVVRTGRPLRGRYDPDLVGPTLRSHLFPSGTTHGAWIPIAPNSALHGVLSISTQGIEISDQLFARAVALGHIVELALANALTLENSAREATTDPLTGLTNRRGFEAGVATSRGRRGFAVLAIDVDDLKLVNDRLGHAVGDALLVGIANSTSRLIRRGDLVARTGGDEFAAFLPDPSPEGAIGLATRILDGLKKSEVGGVVPSVSVGIAFGSPESELGDVLNQADQAMYLAKRRGGQSFALAEPALASEVAG